MSGLSLPGCGFTACMNRNSGTGDGRSKGIVVRNTLTLNRTRVEQLLNQFTGRKIVIVGDVMLDDSSG